LSAVVDPEESAAPCNKTSQNFYRRDKIQLDLLAEFVVATKRFGSELQIEVGSNVEQSTSILELNLLK
jgi:hypothetical protein